MAFKRPGTEYVAAATAMTWHPREDAVQSDYPTLRATTDQADPGLTHTLAITNVTDLQNMTANRAGNYYLTGDIDATATSTWNAGAGFIPIGADTTTSAFTGTFDGCGYTISSLFIDRNSNAQSLFGYVLAPAKIANVTLESVDITGGGYYAAALVSWTQTSTTNGDILIQNCHSSGMITSHGNMGYYGGLIGRTGRKATDNVSGTNYIYDCSSSVTLDQVSATNYNYRGGLIGYAQYTTSSNCFATGSIVNGELDDDSQSLGGFVGSAASDDVFSFCYATGDIETVATGGGFAGGFAGFAIDATFNSCYATGNVAAGNGIGGFVGSASGVSGGITFTDCYAWGNSTALNVVEGEVGGFAGEAYNDADITFTNCYSIGTVSGPTYTGGFIGHSHASLTASNCYWDTESSGIATTDQNKGTGRDTASMKTKTDYAGTWDFVTIWLMADYIPAVDAYWEALDSSTDIRLIPWEHSTDDAYVLQLGHQTIGFLRTTP
uniref:Putative peptidase n=1 Tax=viral metagenome TaxID=1070528 RepID=A0A6M3JD03_9ZZZZ